MPFRSTCIQVIAMRLRGHVLMITAPILATSALLVLLGAAAAWYVHDLNQRISGNLSKSLECALAVEHFMLAMDDVSNLMHEFIDTESEEKLLTVVARGQETSKHLDDAVVNATADHQINRWLDQIRRNQEQFFADVVAVMHEEPSSARVKKISELSDSITMRILDPARKLLEATKEAAHQHSRQNRSLADEIGFGFLVLGACGGVGGLMAGYGIARGVAKRFEQSEREVTRSGQLASIGQLAAGLAHELRNPLMAMRVLVEAGCEQSLEGGGLDRRDFEVLDEEISRLEKLVELFLDFARPPRLEKSSLDARDLVEQTLHLVSGPARQRGVTIEWTPPASTAKVEADPVQMRQVVLNLLLNSVDAASDGGTVTVEVAEDGEVFQGNSVAIQVCDSGPGVPDVMKEKIFEPFVSTKETGMGLGLAVSRRIVEDHGGVITVDDNPAGGARFTVLLPRVQDHTASRVDCQADGS